MSELGTLYNVVEPMQENLINECMPSLSGLCLNEPTWSSIPPLAHGAAWEWLVHVKQITPRLRLCKLSLSNTVLSESIENLWPSESLQLKSAQGWVRHVLISGDGLPLIFARVAVGLATYHRYQAVFDGLQGSLLGESILYKDTPWVRGEIFFSSLSSQDRSASEPLNCLSQLAYELLPPLDHRLHIILNEHTSPVRRSLFTHEDSSLLLTEVFFPDFPTLPKHLLDPEGCV